VWDVGTVALGICLLFLYLAGGWLVFVYRGDVLENLRET